MSVDVAAELRGHIAELLTALDGAGETLGYMHQAQTSDRQTMRIYLAEVRFQTEQISKLVGGDE